MFKISPLLGFQEQKSIQLFRNGGRNPSKISSRFVTLDAADLL